MLSLDAKKLSDNYLQWYKEQVSFKNVQKNVVRIDLPFLDSFQDEIALYAVKLPNGEIKLTDDGWTLNGLEEHGVYINRSKHRKEILNNQISLYGVEKIDDELSVTVDLKHFPEAKHRLLQAVLFVNDMFMFSPTNTSNVFLDDVQSFFNENNIRATAGVSFLGQSGLTHKYDFLISGFKDIPTRLIKTLSASNNDTLFAKSILTDISQTRLVRQDPTTYYVFINDRDKDKNKIEVNPEILTLFKQNNIKAVKFTERNAVIKELAA